MEKLGAEILWPLDLEKTADGASNQGRNLGEASSLGNQQEGAQDTNVDVADKHSLRIAQLGMQVNQFF